jgi:hypothetical protein
MIEHAFKLAKVAKLNSDFVGRNKRSALRRTSFSPSARHATNTAADSYDWITSLINRCTLLE